MALSDQIRARIDKIEGRHNPDNDIQPGAPYVTWAERDLAEIVKLQQHQIDALINALKNYARVFDQRVSALESDNAIY